MFEIVNFLLNLNLFNLLRDSNSWHPIDSTHITENLKHQLDIHG